MPKPNEIIRPITIGLAQESLAFAFEQVAHLFPEITPEKKQASLEGNRNLFADFLNPIRKERLSNNQAKTVNENEELKHEYLFNYDAYDRVLNFMTAEMNKNANGPEAQEIRELNAQSDNLIIKSIGEIDYKRRALLEAESLSYFTQANLKFIELVKSGGKWDHKKNDKFKALFIPAWKKNGDFVPITPILGDKQYLYYYDIWSNIHFGYVGLACGFTKEFLLLGNTAVEIVSSGIGIAADLYKGEIDFGNIFGKVKGHAIAAKDDEISVLAGIGLWEQNSNSLSKQALHIAIYTTRALWSAGSVKLRPQNLKVKSSNIAKLLSRSVQ